MPLPRYVLACACLPVLAGGLAHADPDILLIKTTRASNPFPGSVPASAPARPGATSGVLPASGIADVDPVFDLAGSDALLVERIGLDRWVRASLEPGTDPAQVARRLRALPFVELVEVDRPGTLATIPNDPLFNTQWNLRNTGQPASGVTGVQGADIRAFEAWDISTGGDPVVVATLDSGLYPHAELSGRIQPGYNMVAGSTDTSEVCGAHGTKVAGIIAAAGDNGQGIAGVNWTAVVMPIVVSAPCSVSQEVTAASIVWAVDNGARVINLSLQFSAGNEVLRDAVRYAAASEVVMVAASGNTGFTVSYPAYWPETIAVGAINNSDQRWSGSGAGYELDLVAPGVDVPTTGMFDSYTQGTGTSFAAPHVAGAAALLLSLRPELDPEAIRSILNQSARDLSIAGYDPGTGWGCLDLNAALQLLDPPGPEADLDQDGDVDGGDLAILLSTWGPCAGCPADIDGNAVVDAQDLTYLLADWSE